MTERRRVIVGGVVQGVGFRPFVYRLASELGLSGWVMNSSQGVVIEVEATRQILEHFIARLQTEIPPHTYINHLEIETIPAQNEHEFSIRHSNGYGTKTALILPDLATCPDCLREIKDLENRRYLYPFTNCTHCGPRFSIIQRLPYDRSNTTMQDFVMCAECRAEYENPLDRRFHAQPNACPVCGPQLALWNRAGETLAVRDAALLAAAEALRRGEIVAVKGLGGFHLMVDGRSSAAVQRLRQRKQRYEKPLALMFPNLNYLEQVCLLTEIERNLLCAAAAPIVLVRYHGSEIAPEVAPDSPYQGVMLPYTPLHHLLMELLGFPVVATSGNLSGEPICTDEYRALHLLKDTADFFLVHNRPIARPVDDSVVMEAVGDVVTLRRARGYAPLPIELPQTSLPLLAVGAHQKNTCAKAQQNHIFISQHLGDMESKAAFDAFKSTCADFQTLYESQASTIICDLHPDYYTTRWAEETGLPILAVQHHYAHILSCMIEHQLDAPVLGVAWDGTGYGLDGTIWGGEFLRVDRHTFTREACFRPFMLPGGEKAVREPRRSALGILFALFGTDYPRDRLAFTTREYDILTVALQRGLNAPLTSSAGRLFDAAAALGGLRQRCSYEGQAAMLLEYAQDKIKTDECYPFEVTPITSETPSSRRMIEWKPMFEAILVEKDVGVMSAKFHNTLTEIIVTAAQQVGEQKIVLSGGCFQNRALLERTVWRLKNAGFIPYWQQRIPPNDGGIALGQIAAALREREHVFSSARTTY